MLRPGWTARHPEFDALLDCIAKPFCYFAVSFQIKGAGVHTSHGPMQHVRIKQEPVSDDESDSAIPRVRMLTTSVLEHTELKRFQKTMTRKMKHKNVEIRDTEDNKVPGRNPSTQYQVRIWHLDTREMRSPSVADS